MRTLVFVFEEKLLSDMNRIRPLDAYVNASSSFEILSFVSSPRVKHKTLMIPFTESLK